MILLDRYILRRFFFILGVSLSFVILLVVFVDMVGNLGKFIDKDVPGDVIAEYYLLYIPFIVAQGLPVAMLLSSMFGLGQMSRFNELVAIKSSGRSGFRIIVPLLATSIIVSALAFVFNEGIVPWSNQQKSAIEERHLGSNKPSREMRLTNIALADNLGRWVFIGTYDTQNKKAERITVQTHKDNQIIERIDADAMVWDDSSWVLTSGFQRTFTRDGEEARIFENLKEESLGFGPERLLRVQVKPEDMSHSELHRYTQEVLRNGGDPKRWLVDLEFKLAMPCASIILVLFGATIASQKNRSGAVFGLIISIVIYLLYFGMTRLFQTLGQVGTLSPLMSAWFTNTLFLFAGLGTSILLRK